MELKNVEKLEKSELLLSTIEISARRARGRQGAGIQEEDGKKITRSGLP